MRKDNFGIKLNSSNLRKTAALIITLLFMISIASSFVNNAAYAATSFTLGNTAIGTYSDQNDPNAQSISYFTCTTTGQVTDITAYIAGASAGNAIAALYAINANTPTTLLEQSQPISISTTLSWVDFQLPSAYTVTAGTTYGLAIMGNVPINLRETTGAGQRTGGPGYGSYAKGFTNPFGTVWFNDFTGAMSIYASATTSTTPTATQTPTTTPTPTQTNLAPINDGLWYSDNGWISLPGSNVHYDTQTTYQSNPTWRIDPGDNLGADHSGIYLTGGDHVVMKCWIKTTGTPAIGNGARLGISWFGVLDGQWARIGDCASVADATAGQPTGAYEQVVPYGQDWTLITWDFIVPTTYLSDGYTGMPAGHQFPAGQATVTEAFPWCELFANYGSTQGTSTAYFSDFQFYVNP